MKRTIALTLTMVMALIFCLGAFTTASAADSRASVTISSYSASMKAGASKGELRISYNITANAFASELGVSSIDIYKSNGTYVTTITGTTRNGLVTSSNTHIGTYSYKAVSGTSYYAEVTFFATIGSNTDSKTVTTGTVKTV